MIWFFYLCFLMSLANRLSFLFILSKNQLLALLIFAMVFFVSFAFISALIFMISFFLLYLDYIISSFSSSFKSIVRLFVWFFCLLSWGKLVLLWTFPLVLLLLNPIGFGLSCFHLHLFLCIFWFPFWFIPWFVGYSEVCYLASIWLYF